jgi:hypothetical protein
MKVLITNIWLVDWGGTEVYVRDLAIALHRLGIQVEVYSPELGTVSKEIAGAGIHVTDSIGSLKNVPDIIHAHHTKPTLAVLSAFPGVPAIYMIHARNYPEDTPPKHDQIIRYLASDYNTLDQLLSEEGIPYDHAEVFLNWVDTERFPLREQWSEKPLKALVFSNYATTDNHLKFIQEACASAGLELDSLGRGVGNPIGNPESILSNYDIVFAKAKAAIEAMATGAMVIPCDFRGLGEGVNVRNFSYFRKYNFGMKILNRPIESKLLLQEIKKYDLTEIKMVAARIRKEATLSAYVTRIVLLYRRSIVRFHKGHRIYGPDGELLPLSLSERAFRWLRRPFIS